MHYLPDGSGVQSEIISGDFFISPIGRTNSEAELLATIEEFIKPINSSNANSHAICHYPARYLWLYNSLELPREHLDLCENYKKWNHNNTIDSANVVLATGFLSNPASIYGHLLIRFDNQENSQLKYLLAPTLNFGAIVPKNENMLSYMLKGIFGGYDAGFTDQRFYVHNHNYANKELRDLWSYRLNLTPEQLERLSAHSYELIRQKFQYFFAKQNCAYQMSRLLQLVIDEPVIDYDQPFIFPINIFIGLENSLINGQPAVKMISRFASKQSKFRNKYRQLNEKERGALQLITAQHKDIKQALTSISTESKRRILITLLDYLSYLHARELNQPHHKGLNNQALLILLSLPVKTQEWKNESTAPPHLGQPPSMLQTTLINNSEDNTYASLRYRSAYYDLLSNPIGRINNSSLSMLDISLAHDKERMWLKNFDMVNILNLNISETPLNHDGGWAWQLKFGLTQQNLSCQPCTIASASAGLGKAKKLFNGLTLYAMQSANLQSATSHFSLVSTTASAGFIYTPYNNWSSHFSLGYQAYLDDLQITQHYLKWEHSFRLNTEMELRAEVTHHEASELSLGFSYYF